MAGGRAPQPVDARIYENVVWLLRRYNVRVTAAREAGHKTHGDGTALDLVPALGLSQRDWDDSAGRLAAALGWTKRCGNSGARPACPLKPAIQWVGYDGYPTTARRAHARAAARRTSTCHGFRAATARARSWRRARG